MNTLINVSLSIWAFFMLVIILGAIGTLMTDLKPCKRRWLTFLMRVGCGFFMILSPPIWMDMAVRIAEKGE